jgi:UDP-N-acetylmuramate dehydrogenase
MQIQENISLRPYNTFDIDVTARYFAKFTSLDELAELLDFSRSKPEMRRLVIGGGSNILLTKNFDGLVARNEMQGIEIVKADKEHVYVRAAAGENWHQFVLYCIDNDFAGVENLSLIPGNVGASPMQNIGAYGVEIKDVFHQLEAYNITENKIEKFSGKDCEFGYRESVFKRKYKEQYVITTVTFKLNKLPSFNIQYGAIKQELEKMGVQQLSIQAISQAVISIRQSKLPDPKKTGNAGSFFKNPTINKEQFENLRNQFPAIVGFHVNDHEVKVAAGWLIEQCGWKGYREGDAGCHGQQALVLVNYGHAKGSEIFDLSSKIMESVRKKFGIQLEREVNVF